MRAFIAIELSGNTKDTLAKIQSHLKYCGADVKWIEKDNIHLTLKFLGDITDYKSANIGTILDGIATSSKRFELTLKDIGAFPKIEFPRVIWAGLDKGAAESADIARRIDEELSKIGFERETRPFAAHVTIGRVRSPRNKAALKEKILSMQDPQGATHSLPVCPQIITSVTLFQSTLTPKGSIYTKLHEAKLG